MVPFQSSQFSKRSSIRGQAIGNNRFGDEALALQQFPEQFQCGFLVAMLLDKDIKDLALLIDGPPHEHSFAADPDDHLIQVPDTISVATRLANIGSDGRSKLVGPAPNGFVTEINPAFREQVFDIPQAQSEPVI